MYLYLTQSTFYDCFSKRSSERQPSWVQCYFGARLHYGTLPQSNCGHTEVSKKSVVPLCYQTPWKKEKDAKNAFASPASSLAPMNRVIQILKLCY